MPILLTQVNISAVKSKVFPTRKDVWLHERTPQFVLPLVWLGSVFYLGDSYGGTDGGVGVFFASFFGIPLLMLYLMRMGEYTAIKSLVQYLDYAKRRGNFYYGESNFNQAAKDFILEWWENNCKPHS